MSKSVLAKSLLIGAAALCLTAATALAQPSAPVDPQRLALARQIFEAQGGARNAEAVMRTLERSMVDTAKTPEAKQRVAAAMDAMGKDFLPHMFADLASYYAQDFTDEQLKDILAFYKSPTGQVLREKQPVLAQQIGGTMARMVPRLQLSVLDKVCGQTDCTDQQKQQLASLKAQIPADQRF